MLTQFLLNSILNVAESQEAAGNASSLALKTRAKDTDSV